MIRSYLLSAFRQLKRHLSFSIINIVSLGISMSIGLLIILLLVDQKRYDSFHQDKEKIFRVVTGNLYGYHQASVPAPLAAEISSFHGLDASSQMIRSVGGELKYQDRITPLTGYFADPAFFDVFSFRLAEGNPDKALLNPHSIVLSTEAANKIFGNENPLGKIISFEEWGFNPYDLKTDLNHGIPWGEFQVTGVMADPPHKSHLQFDLLMSSTTIPGLLREERFRYAADSWDAYQSSYLYVKLKNKNEAASLQEILDKLSDQHHHDADYLKKSYYLQPLMDINPGKLYNYTPSITMPSFVFYVLSFFAILVLSLSCINYSNLTIARAMTRAREIGVRKVNGAGRRQIIFQIMVESILISFISLLLALVLLFMLKYAFQGLWINKYLQIDLKENILVYSLFAGFALLVGLLAGILPGWYLSRFQPVKVLGNFLKIRVTELPVLKKLSVYKIMIAGQFSLALIFLVTTLLVSNQMNHYRHMEYGFQEENVVNIELQGNEPEKMIRTFAGLSGVEAAAASEQVPGTGFNGTMKIYRDNEAENPQNLSSLSMHPAYPDLMELEILAGSGLQSENSILINEKALELLGFSHPAEAVGESFFIEEGKPVKITGVVKDFVYNLVFADISPLIIHNDPERFRFLTVKLHPEAVSETLERMEETWMKIDPDHNFKLSFISDQLENSFQVVGDLVKVIGFIASLAIIISCFGLLGIIAFTTELRIREVGIRKTMGASLVQIMMLLSGKFVRLISVSLLFAIPAAYYLNDLWLNHLAHKTSFSPAILVKGVLIVLLLGLVTIFFQVAKVAWQSPVHTIRNES